MTTDAKQYFYRFENLPGREFSKITSSKGAVVQGDNVYFGLVTKARGTGSQPHRHKIEQFNYVLKGTLRVWIDGQEQLVTPGGVIRIPADTPHSILAEEDVEYLMVKPVTEHGTTGKPEDPDVQGPLYAAGFVPKV